MHISSEQTVPRSGYNGLPAQQPQPRVAWKIYVVAIAIILGTAGLVVTGMGLAGHLPGVFNSTIVLGTTGIGGSALLFAGLIGLLHPSDPPNSATTNMQVPRYQTLQQWPLTGELHTVQGYESNGWVFGTAKWHSFLHKDCVQAIHYPHNLEAILNEPCPFYQDKKVGDTHRLMLIPKNIEDNSLTLDVLEDESKRVGRHFAAYNAEIRERYGSQSVDSSYWVLVTACGIPRSSRVLSTSSRFLSLVAKFLPLVARVPSTRRDDEYHILADTVSNTSGYRLPSAIEAAAYLSLNVGRPREEICCQEEIDGSHINVGQAYRHGMPQGLHIVLINNDIEVSTDFAQLGESRYNYYPQCAVAVRPLDDISNP